MASWAPNEVKPDPKQGARHHATAREWQKIKEQFAAACCVTCGLRPIELHHVVPRSQGGDDVVENLVPLCFRHHSDFESHAEGWERIAGHIRAYVMARESRLGYVIGKIGETRFRRRYPEPPFLAIGDLDKYRRPDPSLRESEAIEGYERP